MDHDRPARRVRRAQSLRRLAQSACAAADWSGWSAGALARAGRRLGDQCGDGRSGRGRAQHRVGAHRRGRRDRRDRHSSSRSFASSRNASCRRRRRPKNMASSACSATSTTSTRSYDRVIVRPTVWISRNVLATGRRRGHHRQAARHVGRDGNSTPVRLARLATAIGTGRYVRLGASDRRHRGTRRLHFPLIPCSPF